jgi:Protein of unknown function (DUF2867)
MDGGDMTMTITSIRSQLDEQRRLRLAPAAHTAEPWMIHALAPDFELEDVWALPTPGGPDDLDRLVSLFTGGGPPGGSSRASRALFAIRFKLGELLGWDDEPAEGRDRTPSLRDRLGPELRAAPTGPVSKGFPFTPLYSTQREYAGEVVNRTVHAVAHIGWVPDGDGGYRGQLAVLVKPNGALGRAYMAAIKPFRYLIVYPALIRQIGSAWEQRSAEALRPSARLTRAG